MSNGGRSDCSTTGTNMAADGDESRPVGGETSAEAHREGREEVRGPVVVRQRRIRSRGCSGRGREVARFGGREGSRIELAWVVTKARKVLLLDIFRWHGDHGGRACSRARGYG